MTYTPDSVCACTHTSAFHFAPNDVSVILDQRVEGACARCDCRAYRHAKGPVPKPRRQPSAATIKAVREAAYQRSHPAPHRDGVPVTRSVSADLTNTKHRNTYSDDREMPM